MKLDEEVIQNMTDAIRAGNYVKTACALCGISQPVHYRWMKKGRANVSPLYRKYMVAIIHAEAALEGEVVQSWVGATKFDWHASKEFLARRFPDTWADKSKVEMTLQGPNGGPININNNVDLTILSDEELRNLEALVRKTTKPGDDPEGDGE